MGKYFLADFSESMKNFDKRMMSIILKNRIFAALKANKSDGFKEKDNNHVSMLQRRAVS